MSVISIYVVSLDLKLRLLWLCQPTVADVPGQLAEVGKGGPSQVSAKVRSLGVKSCQLTIGD